MKKNLASKLPQQEVPMVTEGLEGWSVPYSADKPLDKKNNKKGKE